MNGLPFRRVRAARQYRHMMASLDKVARQHPAHLSAPAGQYYA
jgi:hypothetical protein